VQVRPDGSESFVESRQHLEDLFHVSPLEFLSALVVCLLVFLAEDAKLRERLRALVILRQHALERREPAELHLQPARDLCRLRLPRQQDLVQHFLRGEEVARTDPVEKREHVLFLGVIDVLLDIRELNGRIGAEELGQPLAFHAHVARVVFHHVEDIVRRVGGDGDAPLAEEVRHPPLLLVVEHLPEDLLGFEGHRAAGFLFLVADDPLVDLAGKSRAEKEQRGIGGRRGAVLGKRRHLFRARDLLGVCDDHQAMIREEGLVAQAQKDLPHRGLPPIEAGHLGRVPEPFCNSLTDGFDECCLLTLFGSQEKTDRGFPGAHA